MNQTMARLASAVLVVVFSVAYNGPCFAQQGQSSTPPLPPLEQPGTHSGSPQTAPDQNQQPSNPLPDSPGAAQANPQSPTPIAPQNAPAEPTGTAAAPAGRVSGNAASRPAGAAIAPPKQRQIRSLLIKLGFIAGAGVALGTVAALSMASPARVPNSH